ncbi:MAG: AAA family ATPase [Xenococcaceae cyanobacterium]
MTMISSRWIVDFEKHLYRRQHIILYGNVHDQFLWQGGYQGLDEFLNGYFLDKGFKLRVRYDPIDGFNFAESEMKQRFHTLAQRQLIEKYDGPPGGGNSPVPHPAINPLTPPPRTNPGAITQQSSPVDIERPERAFGDLRVVMAQSATSVAAVIDLGDMLTADPDRYAAEERNALMLLKKCTLEATIVREGDAVNYRNTLVLIASDLKRVPAWFYANNPFVALVQITRPNKEERRQFVLMFGKRGFFGGDRLKVRPSKADLPSELEIVADEFADLTDGFRALDLDALRYTSHQEAIPLNRRQMFRLVDFYKFGLREEPFEQISPEKVMGAREELSRSVIGQPQAVEAVTRMLTSAKVGISMSAVSGRSSKPKGIFFFVGPTGVGKTELAKSLTRLLFGDEQAFARFDMSEYKEEHAAEKLVGAPPGFVGYEEGGQLTNRVLERPYSILLFDEIEKAHPKVLDKFLQILEDGRLTDGKGQTAYFNQTVIIFTSNIGASDLTDTQTGNPIRDGIMGKVQKQKTTSFTYEQVEAHFKQKVNWYFTSRIGRAELLNRLGDSIVVFDLLRSQFVEEIAKKFLCQLGNSAYDKHRVNLQFHPSILTSLRQQMEQDDNLLFGGRRIKTLLETGVERPLNSWIFQEFPNLEYLIGKTLSLKMTGRHQLDVEEKPKLDVMEVKPTQQLVRGQ